MLKAGSELQDKPEGQATAQGNDEPVVVEAVKPRGKAGRKVRDPNGEKRTEKVMLYLRASLMADVKDLAYTYRKSITDYIISLLEREARDKQDRLATFRGLDDDL